MGMEVLTPEQRADNGARYLDVYGPENWRGGLDVDSLDIMHSFRCVLGQTYGDFELAFGELDLAQDGDEVSFYGFFPVEEADAVPLTAAWQSLLRGEREPGRGPVVHSEDEVTSDQCGYQVAYGLPWMEFCSAPMGEGMNYCPEHERSVAEEYPQHYRGPLRLAGV